ncbi:MAG TPA: universal stress protein [Thermoplasmata archaeon]|nr:universal stress protein [Thermoplasmata archaeon]
MYRQILVPVQEASEVEPLVRFAAQLLEADGEIRVLHVIPTTTLPQVTREWRASVNLVVPAHEAGAALDVKVDPEVRAATDVPGEILESAESHAVDAILLTLGGDRRSRNPFVGHTASGILQHAHSDVLVLNRLALAGDRFPRILVPTFRSVPPPRVMQVAEEVAIRNQGLPIVTLALAPRPTGVSGPDVVEEQSARGVPITHKRSFFPAATLGRRLRLPDLILQAAARERFGLLVVGEEHADPGGALLTRRFLEQLFRAAPCPVMALRT